MIDRKVVFRNAARYLGYRGRALPAGAEGLMESAYEELLSAAAPKALLKRCRVACGPEGFVLDTLPPLPSQDLLRLFQGALEGYALLATLGAEVDMSIARLMLTNPALGAALGACASAYIDEVIDERLERETDKLRGEGLTFSPRFSPGYGDVPLSYQRPLLAYLEARRIGVRLTESCLMLPEKSVSALLALRPAEEGAFPLKGCEGCAMKHCAYRKGIEDEA